MFKILSNAWKVPEIRKKLLYVLLILAIYRLGNHILLPGIDLQVYNLMRTSPDATVNFFTAIAGGGFASDLAGDCASSLYPTRLIKEEQVPVK